MIEKTSQPSLHQEIKSSNWKTAGKVAVITTLAVAAIAAAGVAAAASLGTLPVLAVSFPAAVWLQGGTAGFLMFGSIAILAAALLFDNEKAQKLEREIAVLKDRVAESDAAKKQLQATVDAEREQYLKEIDQLQQEQVSNIQQLEVLEHEKLSSMERGHLSDVERLETAIRVLEEEKSQLQGRIMSLNVEAASLRAEKRKDSAERKEYIIEQVEKAIDRTLSPEEKNLFVQTSAIYETFISNEVEQVDLQVILPSLNEAVGEARKIQIRHQLQVRLEEILGSEQAAVWAQDLEITGPIESMNEDRMQQIEQQAKKFQDAMVAIGTVKDELQKGFPASEDFMGKMHPELGHLPTFGKQGEELNLYYRELINKAFVTAELKMKTRHFKGTPTEVEVLNVLGYDIQGDYDRSELVKEALITMMSKLMNPDVLQKPTKEVRQLLGVQARYARLALAKVPEEKFSFIQALIVEVGNYRRELLEVINPIAKELKYIQPEILQKIRDVFPHIAEWLPFDKRAWLLKGLRLVRRRFILDSKSVDLINPMKERSFQNFKDSLEVVERIAEKSLEKMLVWLNSLGDGLEVVEFSQGENDESEALGTGVCYSICYHMGVHLIRDPSLSIQQLNQKKISAKERFHQAVYAIGTRKGALKEGEAFLPARYQEREGVRINPLITFQGQIQDRQDQIELLFKKVQSQKGPKGFIVGIRGNGWAHALYMYMDPEKQRYIFEDPNFFTIEKKGVDKAEGLQWLQTSLMQLLEANYEDTRSLQLERVEKIV